MTERRVWCWSLDGEEYKDAFQTREEAIEAAEKAVGDGDRFYVAVGVYPDPVSYMPCDDLIDFGEMHDQAVEEGGEHVPDDWPVTTPEALGELHQFLTDWARRHFKTTWYVVWDEVYEFVKPDREARKI